MVTKEKILEIAKKKGEMTSGELTDQFDVSRQYASRLLKDLVTSGELVKFGSTRNAFYVTPAKAKVYFDKFRFLKVYSNKTLEEHRVLDQIEKSFPMLKNLPENIQSIVTYAFSEMLNNAIEHSGSKRIRVDVSVPGKTLSFNIRDYGVGAFRNVMKKRGLTSEIEAIQDILKGKTTTMPKSHSGEGIFFTSKAVDVFILDSFGYQLIVNNKIPDVFIKEVKKNIRGTSVTFSISTRSKRHLNEVFKKYTQVSDENDYGFDKTEIHVKLYMMGGVHISRSQARRVLTDLEKFKVITFDFDKVPTVGQAFADEIFRVFQNKHPEIKLIAENMNAGVKFMVNRARNEAKKSQV
jgi:anti-sigma regulatory factor (Ser/Thr protein kinase)